MTQIKYLDMFAGVGGFRSGLQNIGDFFVPVGWCEIDKYAQRAYRALYETEGEYFCDDATQINPNDLPEIDLICAGFPCQPFSVSGRRLGFADTRGTLFHEIVRVAEARRPAYLLLENVPGLLNHERGETFRTILSEIHELGYSLEWRVCNSANFGVPQQRRRIYLVGFLDSRLSGKIFPVPESGSAPLIQVIPGGQGQRVYSIEGASTCLTSQGGGQGAKTGLYFINLNPNPVVTFVANCITARYLAAPSNRIGEHSGVLISDARAVLTPERENVRQQGRRMKEPNEPMFTLTAQDRHVKLNIGKLAMWRLKTHGQFGGTWLSDYVPNRLGGFNQSSFEKQVERLYTSNTEVSPDFQCDQTLGFPTSLCWNREEGKAWLALKESMITDDLDMAQFDKAAEAFGIRDCFDTDDFNNLLSELGEDAYQSAYLHGDDEPFDLA